MLIFFVFSVGCKKHEHAIVQELKPWNNTTGPEVNEKFTTEYMRSRPPRMVKKINENWTFNYFKEEKLDELPSTKEYDDSKWPAIAIPHTWQNYETTKQLHPFVLNASNKKSGYVYSGEVMGVGNPAYWWNGWGWYRKKIEFIKSEKSKRIFLEFDGVMKYCKVYFNGVYLGDHKGGFNSFYFDITYFVNEVVANTLAVAVRNKLDDEFRIPPMYSGNQTHTGGIYRDVRIVIKDDVYIPFQGSSVHEGGTFVTTPYVDKDSAKVNVKTWVKNDTHFPQEVVLKTTIEDKDQQEVCSSESSQIIKAGIIQKYNQTLPKVIKPELWSPDQPVLYKVISKVYIKGILSDQYESPLGFRTFKWDYQKNRGVLNGKYIHIHGTNRTQQFPWLNNAIPAWIDTKDIADIRFGLGHNFIRPNIHPNNFLIHDLFDQWGMLVNLSSPMIKDIDFSEEVQEQMIREAVRQHRNHPSIVFYSVGNETTDGADSKWIHEEDTTRIIHARKVVAGQGDFVTHDQTNMDMENLLRVTVRGWPNEAVYPENPKNGQHASNEEWQHDQATIQDGSVRGRLDMPNGVMWMYSDDGAARIYKNCPLKNINPKGWVDAYRVPKYIYFLWRANYIKEPTIFIHPHYWQKKCIGTEQDIVIDSNCEEVSLYVNGKLRGKANPNKENFFTVCFKNILIESGNLKAIGVKQNKEYEVVLPMAGEPRELRLRSSHKEIQAKRNSIVAITADAVDENGTQLQGFNNTLHWEVAGPATLVGPENWETDIHENLADSGAWYIAAPIVNLVRSNGEAGVVEVKVSSPGLNTAIIKINVVAADAEKISFVKEFHLVNEGRLPVEWQQAFITEDSDDFVKMSPVDFDFHLELGKKESYYVRYFFDYIRTNNPDLAVYPSLIAAIAKHFSDKVMKYQGVLVADDYNFIVGRINDLMRFISAQNNKEELLKDKEYLNDFVSKGVVK